MIEVNQSAPTFKLPDSDNNTVSLEEFRGQKNVVLIIYPGDDTPGCILQLTAAKNDSPLFEEQHAVILGINHEDSVSHNNFIHKYDLSMPLLIDEGRKVIESYGAKTVENGEEKTIRSVIIIDKMGVIKYINRGSPETSELIKVLKEINIAQNN